jgi:prolipoprotein diacylglyceryltransferase
MAFPFQFVGGMMDFGAVLRYVVLAISTTAMGVGVAMIAGWIKPAPQLPDHYTIVFGAVVFLYGAFRFVVTFFRNKGTQHHGL